MENPAWAQHTAAAGKQEHKAGIIFVVKGWKCNYCSLLQVVMEFGRLLRHLSCDEALRSMIQPCAAAVVPGEAMDTIRSEPAVKANVNASAAKRAQQKTGSFCGPVISYGFTP